MFNSGFWFVCAGCFVVGVETIDVDELLNGIVIHCSCFPQCTPLPPCCSNHCCHPIICPRCQCPMPKEVGRAPTHTCMRTHKDIDVHVCTHACTHKRTNTHKCTHTKHMHACKHMHFRTNTRTHTQTHMHTHTHTHTHAHKKFSVLTGFSRSW